MSGLATGQRIRLRDGREATVIDPYERCPYTGALLARLRADDGSEWTIVNPGWVPNGVSVVVGSCRHEERTLDGYCAHCSRTDDGEDAKP